ncbi:MAG: class I SAM-dependent methyltransferase [Thiobacillaceae bacterium]
MIGGAREPADAETQFTRRRLALALQPYRAPVYSFPTASLEVLIDSAIAANPVRGLPAHALVLLLAHDQVFLAPGCIDRLYQTIERGQRCAAACDAAACGPGDYQTVRGMERFLAARGDALLTPPDATPPLALLARLEVLRNGSWRRAPRVATAWVHDFSGYREQRREDMLDFLPPTPRSVLDVGGGTGGFLAAVKARHPDCRTGLVETSATACKTAWERVDRVWQGEFTTVDIDERFDCIAFLDVIEHVVDPAAMLDKAKGLLTQEGAIIASIPNVGHWTVIADLLEGRWDYAPAGIHCITHLRYFTRHGIAQLFAEAGLVIDRWEAERVPPPAWFQASAFAPALAIDTENLAAVAWRCRAHPLRMP